MAKAPHKASQRKKGGDPVFASEALRRKSQPFTAFRAGAGRGCLGAARPRERTAWRQDGTGSSESTTSRICVRFTHSRASDRGGSAWQCKSRGCWHVFPGFQGPLVRRVTSSEEEEEAVEFCRIGD